RVNRSSSRAIPIVAAATGLTIVRTASGPPRPYRYPAWASNSPPGANASTSNAAGLTSAAHPLGPSRTVTVWVSADPTPDAMPDAAAQHRPRRIGPPASIAGASSSPTAAAATNPTVMAWFGPSAWVGAAEPVSNSRPASPATVSATPYRSG